MEIGGFKKVSLIEYPGKISSVIFTIGCNFRCLYCYAPQLVLPEKIKKITPIPKSYIFSYLKKNKKFVDAVTITGGEPTIHAELPKFIEKIKKMNFLVALETNGSNFPMLKKLVEEKLVNYVAMDIKTVLDFKKYKEITNCDKKMFENVKKSVNFLLKRKVVDYEFRTTLVKEFHTRQDIIKICKMVKTNYFLQNLKNDVELLSNKKLTPFNEKELTELLEECRKFAKVSLR